MTVLTLMLLLPLACGDKDTDTGEETDTDTDTDADLGTLEFSGTAVVHDSYMGTEVLAFLADEGRGDVICQLSYPLEGAALRSDCDECDWAFDVTAGTVEVQTDVDGACDAIGWGKAARAALTGTARGYGYVAEYFGHAPVLMRYDDASGWNPVSYAAYDEKSGAFDYSWQDATLPY